MNVLLTFTNGSCSMTLLQISLEGSGLLQPSKQKYELQTKKNNHKRTCIICINWQGSIHNLLFYLHCLSRCSYFYFPFTPERLTFPSPFSPLSPPPAWEPQTITRSITRLPRYIVHPAEAGSSISKLPHGKESICLRAKLHFWRLTTNVGALRGLVSRGRANWLTAPGVHMYHRTFMELRDYFLYQSFDQNE